LAKLILSKHKKIAGGQGKEESCILASITEKRHQRCCKAGRKWPEELWELLDKMLTVDQMDRITAKDALKLSFFSGTAE